MTRQYILNSTNIFWFYN